VAKKKTTTKKKSSAAKAPAAASKRTGKAAGSSGKTTTKKAGAKKAGSKKPAAAAKKTSKKVGSGAASKKKTAKKAAAAKKTTKKTTKKTSKKVAKTTKKAAGKPAPATKSPPSKKTTKKAASGKDAGSKAKTPAKAPEAPPPPPPPPAASGSGKPDDKRSNRPRRPKAPAAVMPEGIGGLLSPGGPAPKPLIASSDRIEAVEAAEAEAYPTKSPFNKRELEKFRQILLQKRAEVLSEVTGLEGGALTGGGSGNLSHTPQHMADAGSDAADQTISLDLAAAERNLIKEIDAALQRIRDGVYGLCVATGKPIRKERLAELPWAKYSIEAARQFEGRH
jgi:RNA polymerase-binding transcription factor DksA